MGSDERAEQLVRLLFAGSNVRDKDVELIRLYAAHEVDQKRWAAFFSDVDIDCERFVFNYMLARLGARFRWAGVPQELQPRLKGVWKNFQVRNISLLARTTAYMRLLNEHGVPLLVMRGGALRMSLLPDVPQKMSDVDLVVPRERYLECQDIAVAHGYSVEGYWSHSVEVRENGEQCADLHWCMFKANVHKDEPTALIVDRGAEVSYHGASLAVPSPDDTLLGILVNAASNFIMGQNGKGPITWLADCIDLVERYDISFDTVAKRAGEYGVAAELRVALVLAERFVPGLFSELSGAVGGDIDSRTVRRIKSGLRCFLVSDEEYQRFSSPRHLVHAMRLIYHENACSYHLGDPGSQVVASYVGLMRDRLKNYHGADHVWQLPGLLRERSQVWQERKREADRHAEVQ